MLFFLPPSSVNKMENYCHRYSLVTDRQNVIIWFCSDFASVCGVWCYVCSCSNMSLCHRKHSLRLTRCITIFVYCTSQCKWKLNYSFISFSEGLDNSNFWLPQNLPPTIHSDIVQFACHSRTILHLPYFHFFYFHRDF